MTRSSKRNRFSNEVVDINLVPMMDIFVGLITFLMFGTVFLSLTSTKVDLPSTSAIGSNTTALESKTTTSEWVLRIKADALEVVEYSNDFQTIQSGEIKSFKPNESKKLLEIAKANVSLKKIVVLAEAQIPYEVLVFHLDQLKIHLKDAQIIYMPTLASSTTASVQKEAL